MAVLVQLPNITIRRGAKYKELAGRPEHLLEGRAIAVKLWVVKMIMEGILLELSVREG